MHIHRTTRTRFFTVLGNEALRDNRLSFCARGILGHLLSYPDGQRADIRSLTERTPEGRERVASALRELERFGYLTRAVKRTAQGHLYTEVDVFDAPGDGLPQAAPDVGFPGSGDLTPGPGGDHPVKDGDEEPSLPAAADKCPAGREGGGIDAETAASAELLARLARAEPKLVLGRAEALRLAPLVGEWRRRGASDLHVINALTAGLPRSVYHPARLVETRLRSKMPVERPVAPARIECGECRAPVPVAGLCRSCRHGEQSGARGSAEFVQRLTRGAALARAALRGAPGAGPVPVFA